MSTKFVTIDTDGAWSVKPWPKNASAQDDLLRVNINGWFATVGAGKVAVWIDDEGLFKNLKANIIASGIARQPIVGNVVITGKVDAAGNALGLKATELDQVVGLIAQYQAETLPF